jgi:hypothetical protein
MLAWLKVDAPTASASLDRAAGCPYTPVHLDAAREDWGTSIWQAFLIRCISTIFSSYQRNDGSSWRRKDTPNSMRSTSPSALKYIPTRERPQDSELDAGRAESADDRNHSPAFSMQRANGSLVEGMKHDQTTQSPPLEHESALQCGRTPTAPRSHDSATYDEHPFADEETLHRVSIDSLGAYSGSSISATATVTPSLFLDNIHTRTHQPFIFAKPKPFVGIQGTRRRPRRGL